MPATTKILFIALRLLVAPGAAARIRYRLSAKTDDGRSNYNTQCQLCLTLARSEHDRADLARALLFRGMDSTNVLDGSNKWPGRFRILGAMAEAAPSEADLRALRLRYNAAYSAYQTCLISLNEAAMSRQTTPPDLLKREADALRELTDARGELLSAMAAAVRSDS